MPVNMVKGDNVPEVDVQNTRIVDGSQYSIVRVTGSSDSSFTINANENEDITVILSGVTINMEILSGVTFGREKYALRILGTGNVTILLEGNNTLSSPLGTGISKENSGSLIISNVEGSQSASLNINIGSECDGAGIGGGYRGSGSDITIGGNANVIVVGGGDSAAIGGSRTGYCTGVRILDNATVRLGLYDDNRPYIGGRNWTDIEFTNNSHPTFTGDVLYYEPGATVQEIQNGTARRVNTANLSLKANGGTGNDVVVTRPIGVRGVIPNNTFSRAGHTFSKWNTAANGNGTNYTAGQSVTLTQNLTLYAVWEHVYNQNVASAQYLKNVADCTHAAVYYKSCVCGARGTDNDTFTQGSPLGHDYHYVPGSYESASCTSSGKESDRECSRCHDVIYGSYIPVLPHTYDREVVNATYLKSDADCIHSAVYYKSCICGECGTETFTYGSPLGHFYQEVSESSIAPTCTSEGKEADQSCLRCGDVITGAVIAKLPHTFDQKTASDKYLKTSADCTHEAVYYMSCTCGEKGTETFIHGNALGHDYKEVIGSEVAPGCTSEGKERDLKCTRCQDVITGAVIARLPHTFELRKAEDKYLKTPADCTHEAVYYMSCICGEKGTETFTYGLPLGHDYKVLVETYKAPTCAEPGKEADMECARCHDLIMGKSIPKTEDHKWKEATGWTPRTCEICGLTEGDVVSYRISAAENAGTSDNSKGLTYKKGKKTPLILKLLRSEDEGSVIDHLEGILIDGKDAKYTTDRYDNSVSIAYETLNSLEAGDHTMTVVFNDWREELKFTIEPAVTPKDLVIPIAVVGSLSLAGGLGTAIIVRKRKALK
jgi:uncharacterized repeat protein (TIGR02543 family)